MYICGILFMFTQSNKPMYCIDQNMQWTGQIKINQKNKHEFYGFLDFYPILLYCLPGALSKNDTSREPMLMAVC